MYAYIKGPLIQLQPSSAIIDCQGIGYKIFIPTSTFSKLQIAEIYTLFTTLVVREGFQGLYGFISADERDLFEILIEISGVGPKTALNLIGYLSISDLHTVILQADTNRLSKVPGIGKKTAEKLLIELRNKLESFFLKTPVAYAIDVKNQNAHDAIKALINLGYNQAAAQKAVKKTLETTQEDNLGLLITTALKHL